MDLSSGEEIVMAQMILALEGEGVNSNLSWLPSMLYCSLQFPDIDILAKKDNWKLIIGTITSIMI